MARALQRSLRRELLERYEQELLENERSSRTISKYRHDVLMFYQFMGGKTTLEKEDVIAYKNWLGTKYATSSVNSMLVALNGFLAYAGMGQYRVKLLKVQHSAFCEHKRELTREEYGRLLEAALKSGNERLYLLLQTICATGIRVSELQFITVEAARSGMARVDNKGKQRSVLISKKLRGMLLSYAVTRNIRSGSIFRSRTGRPLDRSNIWKEMKRLCRAAEVTPEKVFPHNLRHLFARTFYDKGKDLTRLADILGHQSINTTRRYIVSSGSEHEKILEALDLLAG